ncbi:MAG: 16S rRNA (guanine(966)-N(2))-methyltransferase RsmD [Bacillota bacterium]|nr:MAG: 16S rRNA (guanine(966)-N(2))-methyltransferase RsmD [Bacillota bacterium]
MRVLGGQARGRRLKSVPGAGTRPPLARVRQALFNVLQPVVPGARWLDLFAGTGSYAIEALSRGADEAVLVELDPRAVGVIKENLTQTGLAHKATVIRGDVLRELPRLASQGRRFDVIGVAPPYFRGLAPRVLAALDETLVLEDDGLVFVQRHVNEDLPARTKSLSLIRDYRYGQTILSVYRPGPAPDRDEQPALAGRGGRIRTTPPRGRGERASEGVEEGRRRHPVFG